LTSDGLPSSCDNLIVRAFHDVIVEKTSRVPGFFKLSIAERLEYVRKACGLTPQEVELLSKVGNLTLETADRMVENAVGTMSYPLSIAVNFLIDGQDRLIPMVIEEPSVVAAASNAARIMRSRGGITTEATEPIMIGQVQLLDAKDPEASRRVILAHSEEILKLANDQDPFLTKLGGGAKGLGESVGLPDGEDGGHAPPGRRQGRNGRQRCEHHVRGSRTSHREADRGQGVPPDHLKLGGQEAREG